MNNKAFADFGAGQIAVVARVPDSPVGTPHIRSSFLLSEKFCRGYRRWMARRQRVHAGSLLQKPQAASGRIVQGGPRSVVREDYRKSLHLLLQFLNPATYDRETGSLGHGITFLFRLDLS